MLGNVKFRHQDVFMSCDSAHFFPNLNILDAFSNVHIWRGDTLDLYGIFTKVQREYQGMRNSQECYS
ncbi:MAG: hypothetical protein H6540_02495 [Bacteroidales bacterium]|nr:hypothetical protein [Bacteroidales bacterium]